MLTVKGSVSNGTFSVKFTLPESADTFLGTDGESVSLPVMIGTWSEGSLLGGSGNVSIPMALYTDTPSTDAEKDTTAPVITLNHNTAHGRLEVSVCDDTALMPGIGAGRGTTLEIDGAQYSVAPSANADAAVPAWQTTIDVARLAPGVHTATAAAVDLAGNSVSKTLRFTASDLSSVKPVALAASSHIAIDGITFSIAAENRDGLELVVTDRLGNVASRCEVSGTEFTLDTDDRGKFPAGVYSAAVRKNSHEGISVYSNSVEFTIID